MINIDEHGYLLLEGDSRIVLQGLPENSIDSVVTDPPYGLTKYSQAKVKDCMRAWASGQDYSPKGKGFMGKRWDAWTPSPLDWEECYRVLKPGGYMLVFAGARTQDLMGIALRLAGFEIRSTLMWVYSEGYPKGMNIAKRIDKIQGVEPTVVGQDKKFGASTIEDGTVSYGDYASTWDITIPSSLDAQKWEGWNTALKPAYEPIILCQKPIATKGIAENVLKYGVGGINIDETRVEAEDAAWQRTNRSVVHSMFITKNTMEKMNGQERSNTKGRWPADFLHDGSEDVVSLFPNTKAGKRKEGANRSGKDKGILGGFPGQEGVTMGHDDNGGSAARYFYCAKASKTDRDEGLEGFELKSNMRVNAPRANEEAKHATKRLNPHPTVKPTKLMRYLCRLITPPDGVILDLYMGSGSTLKAAVLEGFSCVGIDLDPENVEIARARLEYAKKLKREEELDGRA